MAIIGKKVREITIKESDGSLGILPLKALGLKKEEYDFSGVAALRKLLSKERVRMLNIIKEQKPGSIYDLAKKLNRGFKSVFEDIQLLERFGLIELIAEKKNGRVRHKPILISDTLTIHLYL
ncbi:Uncharacterised protein [uncultured archaeon]|nr:Uncharacterised protein [uncultured archaeon]